MDRRTPPAPSRSRAPGRRDSYHHGDLRRALVQAGLDILRETGLPGLTLRAIAARVGVSHTAPRNHFASLEALQSAIAAEGFRLHARAMREGLGPDPSREERLRAAVRGYVAFALRDPDLFALMFSTMRHKLDDPDRAEAASASYAVLSEVSRGLVWPGAAGENRQARTEAMLWSFVHGFATLADGGQIAHAVGLGCPGHDARLDPDLVLAVMPAFRYEDEPQGS
jgi:AcrR family transcriptional regulator